jgi:dihydrofolate reductase
MKPKLAVYVATSIDGFIARKDGGIDWLEFDSGGDSDGEDYGFAKFFESVDLLLMGRHTFEKLLTFQEWFYGDTRLTVLSSTLSPDAIPARLEGKVSVASGKPEGSSKTSPSRVSSTSMSMAGSRCRPFSAPV